MMYLPLTEPTIHAILNREDIQRVKDILTGESMNVSAYVACKMTGLYCNDMRRQAEIDRATLEGFGIDVHHPVIEENIPYEHRLLEEKSDKELDVLWKADKRAIKSKRVVIDTAASLHSTGAKREAGKCRYALWKPYISVWPNGNIPFIARKEDDACVTSVAEAGYVVQKRWGSRLKRMAWRVPIYLKHWDNISLAKIIEFFK